MIVADSSFIVAFFNTDKIEILKSYGTEGRLRRRVRASVPSKNEGKKHDILMEPITSRRDPNRFVEWTRFSTEHRCPFKSNDFTFRFNKKVTTYCPHDIAAYVALSRREAEDGRGIIFQPFPLFKEPMLRLYHTLIYHTAYEKEVINPSGNPGIRRKPLPFAAVDTILMNAWLTLGNKNTFYVHSSGKRAKKMREYDWSKDAPGMKFERRT